MTEHPQLKKRLNISAALTFASGAAASAAIYLTAATQEQNSLVNEFQNSKAYRHELEAYGGKLSVVSDELILWFSSLWQGEELGVTVAVISAAITLFLFLFARSIPDTSSDHGNNLPHINSKG